MGLFEKIKCYLSSALVFWLIYHVATTCPLCKPLPFDGTGNEDLVCKYTHDGYSYIKPYTEPILIPTIEYYKSSPIKPYVDTSIKSISENVIEPYGPIVKEQIDLIYDFTSTKLNNLIEFLNDDSLLNKKIEEVQEDIVIPAEDELDAFIGTPNEEQEKTVEPVTPDDDDVEPTPVPTTEETNFVPETETETESTIETEETPEPIEEAAPAVEETNGKTEENVEEAVEETPEPVEEVVEEPAEPAEEVVPIPEETDISADQKKEEESNGKLEEIVENVESAAEQVAAEAVIEAAEAVGEAL